MLFLNPFLLLGLFGVAIPVIIHLFNRKSVHTTDWGAMQFLSQSMASRTRRIQLEDALLMATRCLIFGTVALALARPFAPPGSRIPYGIILPAILLAIGLFGVAFALWENTRLRGWLILGSLSLLALSGTAILYENLANLRRLSGASEQDVAIIIDTSTSMNARADASPGDNFERAVGEARDIIAGADSNSSFSIIAAGPSADIQNSPPLSDRSELNRILDALAPSDGHMRGPAATRAAVGS
ncbi:MAG: BatA domain-containing protein, partial [Verrucomicrobiales bacterium]